MNHLTWNERLLIVAVVLLVLIGGVVRYCRALRDHPGTDEGDGTAIITEHAAGSRTD